MAATHLLDIITIRQPKMFLGSDVTKESCASCTNVCSTNGGRDVVICRRNVCCKGPQCVEGCLMTPLQLLVHVLLNLVHGHVARALVHDLHAYIRWHTQATTASALLQGQGNHFGRHSRIPLACNMGRLIARRRVSECSLESPTECNWHIPVRSSPRLSL